ncbi:MAG: hypothetical protein FIA97_00490 [Methylococcaceae bacterium]|nr:hypothetical protein [Methylococcaceae bacterium]
MGRLRQLTAALAVLALCGCASSPPSNTADLCSIFAEKEDWYEAAKRASQRWKVPIPVQMAIINQESSFVEDARPARVRFLGIPLWRPSSAYGYGQAKDETWQRYQTRTANDGADRDEFADAVDFVGWYLHRSFVQLQIPKTDAFRHYLAYHEGQGGFQRGTWREKPWLQAVARKVAGTAERYQQQLKWCEPALKAQVAD